MTDEDAIPKRRREMLLVIGIVLALLAVLVVCSWVGYVFLATPSAGGMHG